MISLAIQAAFTAVVLIGTLYQQRKFYENSIDTYEYSTKEEVEKYKTLWKRECEAYKDLAIKTGNWDVEEA